MNRRAFFYTLLAPLVAKCIPKPKGITGSTGYNDCLSGGLGAQGCTGSPTYKFGFTGFKYAGKPLTLDRSVFTLVDDNMARAYTTMTDLLAEDFYLSGKPWYRSRFINNRLEGLGLPKEWVEG